MEKGNQMNYGDFILKFVPPANNTNIVKTIFSIVLGWVRVSHTDSNGLVIQNALVEEAVPDNLVTLMEKISEPDFFASFSTQINSMAGTFLSQINAMQTSDTTQKTSG